MIVSILFYLTIAVSTIYLAGKVKTSNKYAYIEKNFLNKRERFINRVYMIGIFLILFFCSALRFGVGNDYIQYTKIAHEVSVGGYVVTEIGFNKLVNFVYFLFGGEYYEIVFALFAYATLIIFLKAMYEQSVSFSFAFFIFMTMGLYFQTYNTIRYYLALSLTLYSLRYVIQQEWIKFMLTIMIAALFHKSALIVIPLYILASIRWKVWQMVFGILLSVICYGCRDILLLLALELYPSYKDTIYLKGGTSIVGILRGIAILGLYLWFIQKYMRNDVNTDQVKEEKYAIGDYLKQEMRTYAQLNFLAVIVYVFFSFIPVITRIGYYLSVSQILLIPLIVKNIPEEKAKKNVKLIIIITSIIYFIAFLWRARRPGVKLLPYHSWLFMEERLHY